MLGARRGRFYRDGVEIHDVVSAMREMTMGEGCYFCDSKSEAALLITKREGIVQNAPVIPVCGKCLKEQGMAGIRELIDKALDTGELETWPFIKVEPAMIIRTDKPPAVVESALKLLGDAVVQDGSHFEIVEEDHEFFYKPGGQTTIHFFRKANVVMQVTQDLNMTDGIEYFDRCEWDDMGPLMALITKAEKDPAAPQAALDVAEWLKELLWWRLQRAIDKQQEVARKAARMTMLTQDMPEGLMAAIGALLEERDDCDCALCTARRVAMGEQDMDEEPAPGETTH